MDEKQTQAANEALSSEEFWNRLVSCQERGGEMFVDRRSKSITKATILKAYARVLEDHERVICGPKKLNCFGAPYVWAIFRELGVVTPRPAKAKKAEMPQDSSRT